MGMLYELDDIEKRALVMEIKPEIDPVEEARELLSKATPWPWTTTPGSFWICDVGNTGCGVWSTTYPPEGEPFPFAEQEADAALLARAPDLLSALIARIEAQEEDKQLLGERSEVLANELSKVVAERDRMRDALRGVAIMLNTQLTRYEDEPWAQRVRAAPSPKGEQK